MPAREFQRRFYHHPSELVHDLVALLREWFRIKRLKRGAQIDRAFQERLMLTVTEVNGCRYCAYVHARMALVAGVTRADVDALTGGGLVGSPPEQIPALLYAQHWAETDARPDPEVRQRVLETYGEARTEAIELSMRMIRMGNLAGNTWDYMLYRVSLGHWGNAKHA